MRGGINKDFYVIYALSDTQGRARATQLESTPGWAPRTLPTPQPIITVKKSVSWIMEEEWASYMLQASKYDVNSGMYPLYALSTTPQQPRAPLPAPGPRYL